MDRPGTQAFDHFPRGVSHFNHVDYALREAGLGSLVREQSLEESLRRMPHLNAESQQDFRKAHAKYPELAAWWEGVTRLNQGLAEKFSGVMMVGLAASAGLPGVVAQLLEEGNADTVEKRTEAFCQAALSVRGYSTSSKIHPTQLEALSAIAGSGIDTALIADKQVVALLQHGRLAQMLIACGLDPLRKGAFLTKQPTPLISILSDPEWFLADKARRQIFSGFLNAGLDPWQPDETGTMPIEHLFRSVRGLQMLDLLQDHPGRPAAAPLLQQKRQKLARNAHNLKEGAKFLTAVDALILETATTSASASPKRRM